MRPTLTLVCVFLTLACPHICAIKRVAGSSPQAKRSACCEECQRKASEHQESPADPMSEPKERGCFCDGAAFDVGCRVSVDETPMIAWVEILDPSALLLEPAYRPSFDELPHLPPFAGRVARIQFASLLF